MAAVRGLLDGPMLCLEREAYVQAVHLGTHCGAISASGNAKATPQQAGWGVPVAEPGLGSE